MLRKFRIAFAIIFFACITLLFLDFTGTIHTYFGWMAKIQFLPAILALNVLVVVGLLLLTLIFGRVYCSVICPLGIMQDVIAWFGKKSKKNRYSFSPAKSKLRIIVFIAFVVLLVIPGMNAFAILIAPYSAYGRIASNLFAPVYQLANNGLAYLAERLDSYAFYSVDIWIKSISTFVVAIVTFVILAIVSWRNGRTWCNTICPVGTLLGAVSRLSIFKIRIDTDACAGCGLCAKKCKSSCINAESKTIDYSRCVVCFDCLESCNKNAIKFNLKKKESIPTSETIDDSKRKFLSVSALLFAGATVKAQEKKVDGGLAEILDKEVPNRAVQPKPAGAVSLKNFNQHCTACQLCVSVCPNQVLQPSTNISSLMQPEMTFERGYCRPECVKCSEVCPTGAIKQITTAEKSSIQIGHAVWIEDNCIVKTDGIGCDICERHCPVGAIMLVSRTGMSGSLKYPIINTERCIGCGACEHLCPARPHSAMYVEGNEIQREI